LSHSGESTQHRGTTSRPLSNSGESTPPPRCRHYQRCCSAAAHAPQLVCPKPLGSHAPKALSQKVAPPKIQARVSHDVTPAVVAHPEVLAD
jgi:hypothetical protein